MFSYSITALSLRPHIHIPLSGNDSGNISGNISGNDSGNAARLISRDDLAISRKYRPPRLLLNRGKLSGNNSGNNSVE